MPRSRVRPPLGVWPRLTPTPPGRASPPPCFHGNGATARPLGLARLSLPRHPPPQHHPNNVLVILALFIAVALVHTLPWREQVGPAALVERNEQVGAVVAPRLVHPGRVQLRLGHLHDRLGGWGGGEQEMTPPSTSGDEHRRGTKTKHSGRKRERQSAGQQVHDRAVRSQHLERNNAPVRREAKSHTTTTTQRSVLWMPPDHPAHIRASQTRVSPPTRHAAQGAARR